MSNDIQDLSVEQQLGTMESDMAQLSTELAALQVDAMAIGAVLDLANVPQFDTLSKRVQKLREERDDERANMPCTFGIFSGNGWCLLGVILRPDWASIYHGEFALIVWNYAVGWWWDEHPEEAR